MSSHWNLSHAKAADLSERLCLGRPAIWTSDLKERLNHAANCSTAFAVCRASHGAVVPSSWFPCLRTFVPVQKGSGFHGKVKRQLISTNFITDSNCRKMVPVQNEEKFPTALPLRSRRDQSSLFDVTFWTTTPHPSRMVPGEWIEFLQ
jgi:hypothetical protein